MRLSRESMVELGELQRRYGAALHVTGEIDDTFDDPIRKDDRFGEVCMVIRRPSGRLLLAIKTFYPRGAHRLPTGGIHHGERIEDALLREAHEETGLEVEVRQFLAHITYTSPRDMTPVFHTFAFLLEERGGTLGALDQSEEIEEWIEVDASQLPAVADRLASLTATGSRDIGGSWSAWGRFRAVVHRVVHQALMSRA